MTPEQDTFEGVYRRLEETVRQLDAGGQTLDEAIALYEGGMRLARRCQELLDGAELRIVTLQQMFAAGGEIADDADEEYDEEDDA